MPEDIEAKRALMELPAATRCPQCSSVIDPPAGDFLGVCAYCVSESFNNSMRKLQGATWKEAAFSTPLLDAFGSGIKSSVVLHLMTRRKARS